LIYKYEKNKNDKTNAYSLYTHQKDRKYEDIKTIRRRTVQMIEMEHFTFANAHVFLFFLYDDIIIVSIR